MSGSAKVDSFQAINDFRIHLVKFQEAAMLALGEADSDINRTIGWLEREQSQFWTQEIRKRQANLVKAEEALREKRVFKDATGRTPSAVDEIKAVAVAKKRLQEAEGKLTTLKQWKRKLEKEIALYRGGVSRFTQDVTAGVPAAVAHLGGTLDLLDKYVDMRAEMGGEAAEAGAVGPGVGEGSGESMSRPAEEAPAQDQGSLDPEALRKLAPEQDKWAAINPMNVTDMNIATGAITAEQQTAISAKVKSPAPPADEANVLMSMAMLGKAKIILIRMESASPWAWFGGTLDGGGSGTYNVATVAQLRSARPDLGALLDMPAGWMLILDEGGVAAAFDSYNRAVWPVPGTPES